MAMNALRHAAKHSKFMKFILGGFIFLAVGGLVFMDVGGYFRGGLNNTTVAVVGDTKVDIREFDRTLRNVLMQANITPEEAYQNGIVNAILDAKIDDILKAQQAYDLNLNVDNKTIARELQKTMGGQVPEGANLKDQIEAVIRAQGLSEYEIANGIRNQLQTALTNKLPVGITEYTPSYLSSAYTKLNAEQRTAEVISFKPERLAEGVEISQADIATHYEENKDLYVIPEERVVLIGEMTMDMVKNAATDISDEDLEAEYEERKEDFLVPAKRLIAQAVLKDENQAQAVYEEASNNDLSLEEALQAITSSTNGYRESTAYAEEDLPAELSQAAFADDMVEGSISAPVKTALGWHILEVQGFAEETQRSFADVKDDMRAQYQKDALYDVLYEKLITAEDMQDGGDDYKTIANEIGLKTTKTASIKRSIDPEDLPEPMKTIVTNSPDIMGEIFELEEGMSAYPVETDSDSFVIFGVENIKPQEYKPLESVKDEIANNLRTMRQSESARAKIDELIGDLNDGKVELADVIKQYGGEKKNLGKVSRGDANVDSVAVFNTAVNGYDRYITQDSPYGIVTVTETSQKDDSQFTEEMREKLKSSFKSSFNATEMNYLRENTKIHINDDLLKQQYAGVSNQ